MKIKKGLDMFTNGKNMSSSVNRLWSLNRIPVMGSNEVESPNTGVAITYIYCCMSFLIAYNGIVKFRFNEF